LIFTRPSPAAHLVRRNIFRGDAPHDLIDLLTIPSRLRTLNQLPASFFVPHLFLNHLLTQKRLLMLRFLFCGPLLLLETIVTKALLLLFQTLFFITLAPHVHLATLIVACLSHQSELEFAFQFTVLVIVLPENAANFLIAGLGGELIV
jgi:hypothetical protein